ncbi:MAG: hypothetical protein CMJ83_15455 [Planctomycetes bacterium]|nr:hypothetical protein [Planctomycetota bacterium]
MLILGYLFSLGTLVFWIILLIEAFKQSVGLGFACLCIPFVIIWFGLTKSENPKKNLLVGGYVGCWILSMICNFAGGGMGG